MQTNLIAVATLAGSLVLLSSCSKHEAEPTGSRTTPASASTQTADPPDFVPVDEQPSLVSHVEPVYPPLAIAAGIEGKVIVKVLVTKEGTVRKVAVAAEDSGSAIFER